MYINRHIEKAVTKRAAQKGAVIVTGARQIGKTTLLKAMFPDMRAVSFEDKAMLMFAKEDGTNFFKLHPPPLFIDEVQYAPEIFSYIKLNLDNSQQKGQFYLTGSQSFQLMKNVTQSLAGRIGIINMLGLSYREIKNEPYDKPFMPFFDDLAERGEIRKEIDIRELWHIIWRGAMPELVANPQIDWDNFYSDYLNTYLERDVRDLTQVGDLLQFVKFMTVCAAMTGNLLNIASIARDVEISEPTAKRWLSVLQASGVVYLLAPYYNNTIKRAVKTPKIYFLDTGLAAYLTKWNSAEALMSGAMSGSYFETFVVAEILKSYYNAGKEPSMCFFRDTNGVEIDLLFFENGTLYPVEIKQTSEPKLKMIKSFDIIDALPAVKRGSGGVICLSDTLLPLGENDKIIPIWAI